MVSESRLIEDLQEFADELGETPTYEQMNKRGPWSAATYEVYFSKWNNALNQAGLDTNQLGEISRQQLIDELQEFSNEIERVPSSYDMLYNGPRSDTTYETEFQSWNDALRAAGFEPNRERPVETKWDDDVKDFYGPSWPEKREQALKRDGHKCRICGDEDSPNVHHIKRRRLFEDPDDANTLDNMITLCNSCHGKCEGRWTDCTPDELEQKAQSLIA
jgi:HNH endonuclease.